MNHLPYLRRQQVKRERLGDQLHPGIKETTPHCRMLCVAGDKQYLELRADLPAMRTVTIPGAGHHVMIDQPLALVAAIEALLAG